MFADQVRRCLLLGWILILSAAGCEKRGGAGSGPAELLLYAGAGLRPPIEELVQQFEKDKGFRIVTDYAGSEMLLSKIKLSRRGDLFLPGESYYLDQADRESLIADRRTVCYFVPVILVQKGNPHGIKGLLDLLQPDLKLGLGDAGACAVGRVSSMLFEKNNIPWTSVQKNLVYQSLTVNELGLQVQTGSLDAVIVWDAIARYYAAYGQTVPIPPAQNIITSVEAAVLATTNHRQDAEEFLRFAASERGRAVFQEHGYTVDPPLQTTQPQEVLMMPTREMCGSGR